MLMTNEDKGQYITILCLLHQHGGCLSLEQLEIGVGKIPLVTLQKLELTKHGYHSKRLTEETIKRNAFVQSRINNGSKGGRPKKPSGEPSGKAKNNLAVNENEDVIKERNKDIKKVYGEYENVLLTDKENITLIDKLGEKGRSRWIKELDEGIALKGYKYKSHYLAILKWESKDLKKRSNHGTIVG